jgi:hypothetical protein
MAVCPRALVSLIRRAPASMAHAVACPRGSVTSGLRFGVVVGEDGLVAECIKQLAHSTDGVVTVLDERVAVGIRDAQQPDQCFTIAGVLGIPYARGVVLNVTATGYNPMAG